MLEMKRDDGTRREITELDAFTSQPKGGMLLRSTFYPPEN